MSQDPNYPPGVSENDISGERCPDCGAIDGCDCEPEFHDPRSPAERRAEEMADQEED